MNTRYLVSVITEYPDECSFRVFSNYQRAAEAFQAEIGSFILSAFNCYETTEEAKNIWEMLSEWSPNPCFENYGEGNALESLNGIPTTKEAFTENFGGLIVFTVNDAERYELREIEEIY